MDYSFKFSTLCSARNLLIVAILLQLSFWYWYTHHHKCFKNKLNTQEHPHFGHIIDPFEIFHNHPPTKSPIANISNQIESEDEITISSNNGLAFISDTIEYSYIPIYNYKGHIISSKESIKTIDGNTLSGTLLTLGSNSNSNKSAKMLCNKIVECIGYSYHPTAGIFLHNKSAVPLQYNRNWIFYSKQNNSNNFKPNCIKSIGIVDINKQTSAKNRNSNDLSTLYPINSGIEYFNRTFIAWEWNLGRTNNQLFSFEAMLHYAVIYKRTLLFPFPSHKNHAQLFECGLWDLMKLSELTDYFLEFEVYRLGLEKLIPSFRPGSMKIPDIQEHIPGQCRLGFSVQRNIKQHVLDNCVVILITGGKMQEFKFNGPPFNVLSFMIPAKYIRDEVEKFILNHMMYNSKSDETIKAQNSSLTSKLVKGDALSFDKPILYNHENTPRHKKKLTYRLGIHRREMNEGGKDPHTKAPYVCRYIQKSLTKSGRYNVLRNKLTQAVKSRLKYITNDTSFIEKKIIQITDIYDRSCASNMSDIEQILKFHKWKPLSKNELFYLATDGQGLSEVEKWFKSHNPITYTYLNTKGNKIHSMDTPKWSRENEIYSIYKYWENIGKKNGFNFFDQNGMSPYLIKKRELVYFDMWILTYAEYFIGSWHSTLTRNICHWRGYNNLYYGTNCFLVFKWESSIINNETQKNDFTKTWYNLNAADRILIDWQRK